MRRSSKLVLTAVALATIVGFTAGCNTASGQPTGIVKKLPAATSTTIASVPPLATATTTPPGDTAHQAVIDGWIAAENAITGAFLAQNPRDPLLLQTMVDPELSHNIAFISLLKTTGSTVKGYQGLGHPVVTAFSSAQATVHSCMDGALLVYGADGKPLPTSAGQHTWDDVTSIMVPNASGRWVMQSGVVKHVASCPA